MLVGQTYYECDDFEKAIADFTTALALDPKNVNRVFFFLCAVRL